MMLDQQTQPAPEPNGSPPVAMLQPVPPAGPMIPRVEEWVDLPEPYEMLKAKIWVDYPQRLAKNLATVDDLVRMGRAVVLAHNGWQDDEGPLPPPDTDEFWARCPTHLCVAMLGVLSKAASTPPNSLLPAKGSSPRG